VVATLSLADARTTFKSGQPVTLVLSFSGRAERYNISSIAYPGTPGPDKIRFTPADGVAKIYNESYGTDYAAMTPLGAQPVTLRLILNNWFRFDKPGHYSVEIESSRVFLNAPRGQINLERAAPVTTNAVEFDIVPMTEEEEASEVARLKSAARPSGRAVRQPGEDPQRDLAYLTGDAAARDEVAQALRGRSSDLLRFRNRELVLHLLEEGYLKPDSGLSEVAIRAMVSLRNPKDKADSSKILIEYLRPLSAALPSKSDRARMSCAEAILWLLQRDQSFESQPEIAAPAIAAVRDHFEASNVESMLRVFWPLLKDPSLIPALERILNNPRLRGRGNRQERRAALNALFDLAPERARAFVITELQDPEGLRDPLLLGRIPDADLPELDASLLSRIQALAPVASVREKVRLTEQSMILARFASPAILPDLLRVYETSSAQWDAMIRAHFLAYFVRRQGDSALPLVTAAAQAGAAQQGTDLFVLSAIADCYFSEPLARLLRERLKGDESRAAATSAYLLSKYGARDDTQLVEVRLNRVPESDTWLKRDLTEALNRLRSRFP
jgi:hypothetical protein